MGVFSISLKKSRGDLCLAPIRRLSRPFSVNAFSVTYPKRTAGRRLENLGVRMREHFCIFEKFTRSTEIIYK